MDDVAKQLEALNVNLKRIAVALDFIAISLGDAAPKDDLTATMAAMILGQGVSLTEAVKTSVEQAK